MSISRRSSGYLVLRLVTNGQDNRSPPHVSSNYLPHTINVTLALIPFSNCASAINPVQLCESLPRDRLSVNPHHNQQTPSAVHGPNQYAEIQTLQSWLFTVAPGQPCTVKENYPVDAVLYIHLWGGERGAALYLGWSS